MECDELCNDNVDQEPHILFDLYDMSTYDIETLSKTPLYDGATISVMDALVKYFSWFSERPGISKKHYQMF